MRELTLQRDKTTKGTYRFATTLDTGRDLTVYLPKEWFKDTPEQIRLTVDSEHLEDDPDE